MEIVYKEFLQNTGIRRQNFCALRENVDRLHITKIREKKFCVLEEYTERMFTYS